MGAKLIRRLALVAPALLLTWSCSRAAANTPDRHNPAHRIAAFNNAAYWFKVGHRPEKIIAMMARGAFEMQKVKARNVSPAAVLTEAKTFTQTYVKDQKTMDALFVACGSAQDADPHFREELPALLARVRSAQADLPAY
jgi:hypothetical protein